MMLLWTERFLSVLCFIINNIDTLMMMMMMMMMILLLLEGQQYILTYRFSQDHLELLFNSIRASGRVHIYQLQHYVT